MTETPVVLFTFAGRKENMELQFLWADEVLSRYPEVRYDVWNLARDPADNAWLRSLSRPGRSPEDPGLGWRARVSILHEFGPSEGGPESAAAYSPGAHMRSVWAAYGHPAFREATLIKVDDDVIFLDPARFGDLVSAVRANPGTIVSADVVNNGACLQHQFRHSDESPPPDCGPYQVHASAYCAAAAHAWFLSRWRGLLPATNPAAPAPVLVEQRDWVSINAIGLDWQTARVLASRIGKAAPPKVAGHRHGRRRFGDEGAANTLPRAILRGCYAAHLSFAPQAPSPEQMSEWRAGYARVLEELLINPLPAVPVAPLPDSLPAPQLDSGPA